MVLGKVRPTTMSAEMLISLKTRRIIVKPIRLFCEYKLRLSCTNYCLNGIFKKNVNAPQALCIIISKYSRPRLLSVRSAKFFFKGYFFAKVFCGLAAHRNHSTMSFLEPRQADSDSSQLVVFCTLMLEILLP